MKQPAKKSPPPTQNTGGLFSDFDFSVFKSPDFKEDSVREEIIKPVLDRLGYKPSGRMRVIRSRTLTDPWVKIGSTKRKISHFPDYILEIDGKAHMVLDAKAPTETIDAGEHPAQAYYYAIHHEVRAPFYGLCNGKQWAVFGIDNPKPLLLIATHALATKFDQLAHYLVPVTAGAPVQKAEPAFDYLALEPLEEIKDIRKQSAKRHFGVHGYFTKQSWDLVQAYIGHFSKKGDCVLDPFGGTGVTAIEAIILGRKAIHVDLNPLSVFWVQTLLAPVTLTEFSRVADAVLEKFERLRPQTDADVTRCLKQYPLPHDLPLPKGADVPTVHKLFTPLQMAELALLKNIILTHKNTRMHPLLLLAFSGAITKINLTYHPSEQRSEGGGDSGVFRYYRYRVAPKAVLLDLAHVYKLRIARILNAKKELQSLIDPALLAQSQILKGDATQLTGIPDESVDYIYTDPPYGNKIPYLDLSTMWNAWLDLDVSEEDFAREAIEGGSRSKSKEDYSELITRSLQEMFRVLKWDRWVSFVFQHQDPKYWHLIVDTAEKIGFEYVNALSQNNGQTSFKKRQNYFTVLSGQMIINFRKVKNPRALLKGELGVDVTAAIFNNIEALIARKNGATLEEIYNDLVIHGLEFGYLDVLSKEYSDLTPLLVENFDFNRETKRYHLQENRKFKSHVPLPLRIRYFLISFLKRKEREKHYPTFDEIVYYIMPLLRNGVTPENQDIRGVLEQIAVHQGSDRWRLQTDNVQQEFML